MLLELLELHPAESSIASDAKRVLLALVEDALEEISRPLDVRHLAEPLVSPEKPEKETYFRAMSSSASASTSPSEGVAHSESHDRSPSLIRARCPGARSAAERTRDSTYHRQIVEGP